MAALIAGTATAGKWLAGHIWTVLGRLVLILFGFQLGWLAAVCLMDFTARQFAFYDKATSLMQEANTAASSAGVPKQDEPKDASPLVDLTGLSSR
jgi:hypothetical protein